MGSVSTPQPKLYTAQDVEQFDAQGYRFELIHGELKPMSPTSRGHGRETMNIAGEIWHFVREHQLGETYAAETGFWLTKEPDTVLAPDVAFVCNDRLVGLSQDGFVECVPYLVVETRSPSDSQREVAAKIKRWLDFGVRLVIDLDPAGQTLTIHRPGAQSEMLGPGDIFSGYDVLPGLTLPVSRIFRQS